MVFDADVAFRELVPDGVETPRGRSEQQESTDRAEDLHGKGLDIDGGEAGTDPQGAERHPVAR